MNQLKADMLVAIQVARSGSTSPVESSQQPDFQAAANTVTRDGVQLSLEVRYKSSFSVLLIPDRDFVDSRVDNV